MDDLASSTSEQWRLRVGRLWGMPYQEHPPERLQTADARLVSRSGWPGNAHGEVLTLPLPLTLTLTLTLTLPLTLITDYSSP